MISRAPCPGFDSTVRIPPTVRARSLMEMGPNRRRSNSSPVNRPAKLKPSPLSSTTNTRATVILLQFYHDMGSLEHAFLCCLVLHDISGKFPGKHGLARVFRPNRSAIQGYRWTRCGTRSAKPRHQVHQVGALHPQGPQVRDHVRSSRTHSERSAAKRPGC